jgi:hypothetical protein
MDFYPRSPYLAVVAVKNTLFEYRYPRRASCRIKISRLPMEDLVFHKFNIFLARKTQSISIYNKNINNCIKHVINKVRILPTNPLHQLTNPLHRDPSLLIYKFLWNMKLSSCWRWRLLPYKMWRCTRTYVSNFQKNVTPQSSVYLKSIPYSIIQSTYLYIYRNIQKNCWKLS